MLKQGFFSQEPFVPHAYDALIAAGVFGERMPSPEMYGYMVKNLECQSYARIYRIWYNSGGAPSHGNFGHAVGSER